MQRPETDSTTDQLLAVRCQLGEREAFDLLVDRWHPRLWRYLRRWADDVATGEELLQDTWLRILRGLPSLRDPARLAPWMYRIARYAAMDRLRGHYRRLEQDSSDIDPDLLSGSGAIDEQVMDRQMLADGLDRLPLVEREALELFYLHELSQKEIAEALSVPVGTVKSRLHRARRMLRQQLDGADHH